MSASALTAAVVGCGGIGQNHLRALASLGGVDIRAVVDPVGPLAEAQAAAFGVTPLASPAELPDDLDLVVVATPPATHYPVVRDLLARGFHVFCEKPLTLNVASSRWLVEQARAGGRHLGVGFKMRYEPWFTKARELLPEIGTLLQVTTTKQQARHDKPWLPETGAMQELSSHDFDLIHWLAGTTPERLLHARLDHRYGWPAEDGFGLQVLYANGMIGSLNGLYGERIKFTGRDATFRFAGTEGYLHIDRGERVLLHRDQVREFRFDKTVNGFERELGDFAAAIRGESERYPDGEAAVWSTWVVEQANLAAGRPAVAQPGFEEKVDA